MNGIIRDERGRQQAHDAIDRMDFKGGSRSYWFELKVHRKRRSLPQNRLYWMLVAAIAEETGGKDKEHKRAVHLLLRRKFLGYNHVDVFGTRVHEARSTTELDTAEFTEYIDNIYLWADEQGIHLPRPDELGWDEFVARYEREHGYA